MIGLAEAVVGIRQPAYAAWFRGGGRGIDSAVCFKMLMNGSLESLPRGRSIAVCCAVSLSIQAFPAYYYLYENTPDHSGLSIIRGRLVPQIEQAAIEGVLSCLRERGLLIGRPPGIDSSIIEATASLRDVLYHNTKEQYWEYVKRLATQADIDQEDMKAVRRFVKNHEGLKTSNEELVNPNDRYPKVGMTKYGGCGMIYKLGHITDRETGGNVPGGSG